MAKWSPPTRKTTTLTGTVAPIVTRLASLLTTVLLFLQKTSFQCYVCKESLVTQTFYPLGVEVVCAKHVDADVGGTCPKCGEDIVGDYVEADGERYHDNNQCFVCAYAGCALDGGWGRGADGEPYCFPHLQLMGAKRCVECQKMISSELVTFGGQSYHRRCMVCAFCQNPLADGKFYEFDQKPFCYEW